MLKPKLLHAARAYGTRCEAQLCLSVRRLQLCCYFAVFCGKPLKKEKTHQQSPPSSCSHFGREGKKRSDSHKQALDTAVLGTRAPQRGQHYVSLEVGRRV